MNEAVNLDTTTNAGQNPDMKPIKTKAQYRAALNRVERLMDKNPTKNSRPGKKLIRLADAVERYEKKHFPI